jgi:hypothetical protein
VKAEEERISLRGKNQDKLNKETKKGKRKKEEEGWK